MELLEYQERGYIESITYYSDEVLIKRDLPINGVLKQVTFLHLEFPSIQDDAIPHGVEVIEYSGFGSQTQRLAELPILPSTVHTIKNVDMSSELTITKKYKTPPNITSISFRSCPNISGKEINGETFIVIQNTIKELKFGHYWSNTGIKLRQGDIPSRVTNLNLGSYDISFLSKGILPNSITQLSLYYQLSDFFSLNKPTFNFMPPYFEVLCVAFCVKVIARKSNLYKCNSIIILQMIVYDDGSGDNSSTRFQPNSLPSSIINLSINNKSNLICEITRDFLPNIVTSLSLDSYSVITQPDILPSSLVHLELVCSSGSIPTIYDLNEMISILPQSLTSISLPKSVEQYNLIFPHSLNNIDFKKILSYILTHLYLLLFNPQTL